MTQFQQNRQCLKMKRAINQQSQQSRFLLSWLNSILQPHEVQLEQLGNGVTYCLLLHHYFPSLLNVKKVCMAPRRHLDNLHNLRILTEALATLKWNSITFDITKVANHSYSDNLQLLNKLHSALVKLDPPAKTNYEQYPNKPSQFSTITKSCSMMASMNSTMPKTVPQLGVKSASMQDQYHTNSTLVHSSRSTTPLKNHPKMQPNFVDSIKEIVKEKGKSDREKVKALKNLLGIEVEDRVDFEQEIDKDLLSDYNKKQATIILD